MLYKQNAPRVIIIPVFTFIVQSALARSIHFSATSSHTIRNMPVETPDAIVIGSGLAGLTATLNILDRGGKVLLLEKETKPGGNSIKASSGINAIARDDGQQQEPISESETIDAFVKDTIQSAGENANPQLIETLVHNSADALQWLKDRVSVDLTQNRTQLGGHSSARTYRPEKGAVGFTVMSALQQALKTFEESGHLEIRISTRVTEIQRKDNQIWDVQCITDVDGSEKSAWIEASNVVLATGGFAADRSPDSLLASHCPEYLQMPATFGDFSTGDGIKIATSVGAATCNLDKVQVHPTGFVDPANPTSNSKFLCAELMRGLGGILLNSEGKRFCNELGTRSYVTDKMFQHEPHYATTGKWDSSLPIPVFTLVLSSQAAKAGGEHLGFYTWKKLMRPCKGVTELATYMGVSMETLKESIEKYRLQAIDGSDQFGKTVFPNSFPENLEDEEFFAGQVTPVLHYCMGGLTTDSQGRVLDENKKAIMGLYAAGEVVGGVHGDNRLAGNSLLECLVFGTIIGNKIVIAP